MNPYKYNKHIDLCLVSEAPEFLSLVDQLLKRIKVKYKEGDPKKRFRRTEHEITLVSYLAAIICMHVSDPERYLRFWRAKKPYSNDDRYSPKRLARGPTCFVIDYLKDNDYIDHKTGDYDKLAKTGNLSVIKATEKLSKAIRKFKITSSMFYQEIGQESIILRSPKQKDSTKTMLDYPEDSNTSLMRENLKLINENIRKHWIDIKLNDNEFDKLHVLLRKKLKVQITSKKSVNRKSPIDFTRVYLRRIFNNGSFKQGGRFYHGWWQEIPSKYRKRITIDGEDTIEIDFSSMHFVMMYAKEGLDTPDSDPYQITGLERKRVKTSLNIAINSKSKLGCLHEMKKDVWKDKTKVEVESLLNKMMEKHKAISKYFFSGYGIKLQHTDSVIAESVMLRMLEKHDTSILPVHDSFIVKREFQASLKYHMVNEYRKYLGTESKVVTSDDFDYGKAIENIAKIDYSDERFSLDAASNVTKGRIEAGMELVRESFSYENYETRRNQWTHARESGLGSI